MKENIQHQKPQFIKSAFYVAATTVLFTFSFAACNSTKPEDTKEVATEHNEAKFDSDKESDAKYLVSASEINLEEVQLGQLAQTKGTAAHVKELGKMMEDEHVKAQAELEALAAKKQITIPTTLTDDGMSANRKLMDLKASDFDKEYSDRMVKGHKDAIDKMEKASTDATDPDIRNWATAMLPTLRTHLDHSLMCQKECEKR